MIRSSIWLLPKELSMSKVSVGKSFTSIGIALARAKQEGRVIIISSETSGAVIKARLGWTFSVQS
jgi:Mrp family chromosome partitioning ATPase